MTTSFIETKATLTTEDDGVISGIAWPFGTPDRVGDVIEKSAFTAAMAPLPMLFGHDHNEPVGVWDAISVTTKGLEVSGRLLTKDVVRAREVHALVKAKSIGGLSIGFMTQKATPRKGGGRNITALDLMEISLVAVPCHPGARVSAKTSVQAIRLAEAINRAAMALRTK